MAIYSSWWRWNISNVHYITFIRKKNKRFSLIEGNLYYNQRQQRNWNNMYSAHWPLQRPGINKFDRRVSHSFGSRQRWQQPPQLPLYLGCNSNWSMIHKEASWMISDKSICRTNHEQQIQNLIIYLRFNHDVGNFYLKFFSFSVK